MATVVLTTDRARDKLKELLPLRRPSGISPGVWDLLRAGSVSTLDERDLSALADADAFLLEELTEGCGDDIVVIPGSR